MDYEKISDTLYYKASHHKFAKRPSEFDKGYVKISDWVNELCWYYLQKHKACDIADEQEFKALLEAQRKKVLSMKSSDYQQGLLKALDDIL